jgi:hypothetical protein
MPQETTYTRKLEDLGRLLAALLAHAAALPHLEGVRLHLDQLVTAAVAADHERIALTALIESRQDVRRQLLRLLGDSERVATALRKMVIAHYGRDSEKLAEFGIEPHRSRRNPPQQP